MTSLHNELDMHQLYRVALAMYFTFFMQYQRIRGVDFAMLQKVTISLISY